MCHSSICRNSPGSIIEYEIDEVDKKEVASGQRPESRRGKFAPVYEAGVQSLCDTFRIGNALCERSLRNKGSS